MTKTAAVLLSRQALRPCARTAWVRQTEAAVKRLKENRLTLLTSTGMPTWEMLTALASLYSIPVEVYLICTSKEDFSRQRTFCVHQFNLDETYAGFTPVNINDAGLSKDDKLAERDRAVIEASDILVPVAIKKNGNMANLLRANSYKEIIRDFEIAHEKRQRQLAYEIDPTRLSDEIVALGDNYLFHWTRTFNTAWPGERLLDFYRDILSSPAYPRSAFDTLGRILEGKKIIASGRHMPGYEKTVSFSASSPVALLPLMKWRARYRQMSFEPYGVGIRRETAQARGICPVRYYENELPANIGPDRRWLCQSAGRISDWRRENEYRFRGDFDFAGIDTDDIIAVCRDNNEARALENATGFKTVAFTD